MAVDSIFSRGFAGAGEPGPRTRLLVMAKETEGSRSVAALRAAVHLPEVKPRSQPHRHRHPQRKPSAGRQRGHRRRRRQQ